MDKHQVKKQKRVRRHAKVRSRIIGTGERPRLCVYKSNRYLHAQLIDDSKGITIVGLVSKNIQKQTKTQSASVAGKDMAKLANEKKIIKVVFDRSGFYYTGRIRAFADSARENGLVF